jgi:dihydropteroate synthase
VNLIRSTLDLDSRVQVMGVLNVTPDSFSDGGQFDDVNRAVDRAFEIEAEGAQIIDVGGQSTRPGSKPISVETELARVMPVLERLSGRLQIPLSIDTARSAVARAAVEWGAELINDISGLRFDPELAEVAVQTGAGLVLMHSRGTAETLHKQPPVKEILSEVVSGLRESVEKAQARGVRREKIVIDPGIGFGKTPEQNLELINHLDRIGRELALPVLLGPSRKSFIRLTLDRHLKSVQRDEDRECKAGTAACVAIGVLRGARIIRVHDVGEMVSVVRMAEAIAEE